MQGYSVGDREVASMTDFPPLYQAIIDADVPMVRRLAGNADLSELWNNQMPALSFAVSVWSPTDTEDKKIEICRALLEAGAPVNSVNAIGATALDDATMAGKSKIADFLARNGGAAKMNPTGLSNQQVNTLVSSLGDDQGDPRADLSNSLFWSFGLSVVGMIGTYYGLVGPEIVGAISMAVLLAAWLFYWGVAAAVADLSPAVPGLSTMAPGTVKILMFLTLWPMLMPVGFLVAAWALYATRDS